ncbi:MAG: hypothetical protein AWU54_1348 [Candidatus Frackibacter sp. T328-2]|nr:MAG: hypothetical protein AWU54_1348 [Candidatus Frackibacter sp. T328-2]
MGQTQEVIIKDVNIESAINEGLQILDVNRDQVSIEVIEKSKKGFLGFGKKLAKVKLTVAEDKDTPDQNQTNDQPLLNNNYKDENLNSKERFEELVFIEEDKIRLKKTNENSYPVIQSGTNINLYVNNNLVKDSILVSGNDDIRVETEDKEPNNELNIDNTQDKMMAFLKITQQKGIKYKAEIIQNTDNDEILIIAKEIREIEPPKVDLEEVYKKLKELNITYGIKEGFIKKAIESPGEEFLIAEGRPATGSVDEKIEYLFNKEDSNKNISQQPAQKIDYFSINSINSVKKGEVLAIKHASKYGKVGYNIFGEKLGVKPPQNIDWQIGDGVEIIGDKAVATKDGRPAIQNGELTIFEIYVVKGDVNLSEGNIDFNGDVIVMGDVCENFQVKATGMIKVNGNVAQAFLEAGGDILVKNNIIGSEVVAGGLATYYQKCYFYLNKLVELFEELEKAILQLKSHKSFKTKDLEKNGEKQIIQLLLDTKYTEISKILKEFYTLIDDLEQKTIMKDLNYVVKNLKGKISENGFCKIQELTELIILRRRINDVCQVLKKFDFNVSKVQAGYLQNSYVNASGDIIINRNGAYNSNLNAGGKIEFKGIKGVFRGGNINSQGDIMIKELGSPGGSKVQVQVPEGKKVYAKKAYINVVVKIGNQTYKFDYEQNNITVTLDDDGYIRVV